MRHSHSQTGSDPRKRGAALLLSLLILVVLVAIVIQINVGTGTDARIARNDIGLTSMDLAVESAFLQVDDQLAMDGQNASAPGAAGAAGAAGMSGAAPAAQPGAAGAAGGEGQAASDSRKDEWARPQRTTINEIRLRILVQDEDSKINVLACSIPTRRRPRRCSTASCAASTCAARGRRPTSRRAPPSAWRARCSTT
jgi:Tfp pilus assembly protein PilX